VTEDLSVRCDNQHFVPAGSTTCRRCEGDVAGSLAVVTAAPPRARAAVAAAGPDHAVRHEVLTLGEYAAQRNHLAVADAGVLVAALGIVAGGLPALVPALLAGVVATLLARLAVSVAGTRLGPTPGRAPLPASSSHVRTLDRLVLAPIVAVVLAVLAVLVRAS
jgi:hypothetical protein